jgi:hypothetical protein
VPVGVDHPGHDDAAGGVGALVASASRKEEPVDSTVNA